MDANQQTLRADQRVIEPDRDAAMGDILRIRGPRLCNRKVSDLLVEGVGLVGRLISDFPNFA
jgi:hypothetical protein